ncbi:major facilitator superfamily domain-containing protein [Dipodascopsis uninucleata]
MSRRSDEGKIMASAIISSTYSTADCREVMPEKYDDRYIVTETLGSKLSHEESIIAVDMDMLAEDEKSTPSRTRAFLSIFWDTFNKPKKERKFVQRLDVFLLTYSMVSFIIKTIDSGNISNAFVSGMKEELNLNSQERNLFSTAFDIGTLIGSIPSQLIINRIRPSVWLPTCEIAWSLLVIAMASAKSATPIYIYRFFIGLLEAAAYPGFSMVLGSWYLSDELAKRLALYDGSYTIAHMLSGTLQAAVYSSMNGRYGLSAWRWLFIMDGLIGLPIGIAGYFCIPDFPNTTRAPWLSAEQRSYAVARMEGAGRRAPRRLTWVRIKGIAKSWRVYGFVFPFVLFTISSSYSLFNLWLKDLKIYSVEIINIIPLSGYALGLTSAYALASLSDYTRNRCLWLMIAITFRLVGNLLLAIWEIPFWLKMTAFIIPMAGEPTWSLLTTWAQEAFQDDAELRGLLPAIGGTVACGIKAWLPLFIFPTYEAPKYRYGYKFTSAFIIIEMGAVLLFGYMINRERRKKNIILNEFGLPIYRDDISGHVCDDCRVDDIDDMKSMESRGKTDSAGNVC